jgi:hypothetical protein
MKQIFLLLICALVGICSFSQTRFGTAEFNKKEVPAVIGEIPYDEDVVKDAIDKNFEKMGYKGKKTKGFMMYPAVLIAELGIEPHDIYMMVERKSRQEKGTAVVTFLISKGFENFANDVEDASLISNTRVYLTSLRDVVAAYDLELQIEAQEEVAKKAEKKYINLQEDGVSLLKKKKKIEEEISQNNVDQATQKNEKERQKQILETLKNKRRPVTGN